MKSKARVLAIFAVLAGVFTAAFWAARKPQPAATYSEFLSHVRAGEVRKATVAVSPDSGTDQITYILANGTQVKTVIPSDYREAMAAMREKAVDIEMRNASLTPLRLLTSAAPFLLLLGVWVFMMSRGMRLRLGRVG